MNKFTLCLMAHLMAASSVSAAPARETLYSDNAHRAERELKWEVEAVAAPLENLAEETPACRILASRLSTISLIAFRATERSTPPVNGSWMECDSQPWER